MTTPTDAQARHAAKVAKLAGEVKRRRAARALRDAKARQASKAVDTSVSRLTAEVKRLRLELRKAREESSLLRAQVAYHWNWPTPHNVLTHAELPNIAIAGVYVFATQDSFKVGRSRNVKARLRQFQEALPYRIVCVAILSLDPNDEQKHLGALQRFLKKGREWFHACGEVREYIRRHAVHVRTLSPAVRSAYLGDCLYPPSEI